MAMATMIDNIGNLPAWLRFPLGQLGRINHDEIIVLVQYGAYEISNAPLPLQPPPVADPNEVRTLINFGALPLNLIGPGLPAVLLPGNAVNLQPGGRVKVSYNNQDT